MMTYRQFNEKLENGEVISMVSGRTMLSVGRGTTSCNAILIMTFFEKDGANTNLRTQISQSVIRMQAYCALEAFETKD